MIYLESSDGLVFEVDKVVALKFGKMKDVAGNEFASDRPISVPDVTGEILGRIINYCRKHAEAEANDRHLKAFDADFVSVEHSTLLALCKAAYNLNIEPLLDLTCKAIARILEGKTGAEIDEILNMRP